MRTIATIDSHAIAAAFQCQAHNDVRYYLNGLLIQSAPSGGVQLVATDGHKMIVVTDENGTIEYEKPGDEKSTRSPDLIVRFPKSLITKCKQKTADKIVISEMEDRQFIGKVLADTELVLHMEAVELVDGRYPDWQAVIPKAPCASPCKRACYNIELLIPFAMAAKCLDVGNGTVSVVNGKDANTALTIQFGACRPGLHARGVMMPMRMEKHTLNWLPVSALKEAA